MSQFQNEVFDSIYMKLREFWDRTPQTISMNKIFGVCFFSKEFKTLSYLFTLTDGYTWEDPISFPYRDWGFYDALLRSKMAIVHRDDRIVLLDRFWIAKIISKGADFGMMTIAGELNEK